ncbi:PREDICTED: DOWNY MILDEW RESISTANCE [Prunus dulcis]|uniref:PREDICTED: DOWNY MILDEW RESISTANCE n=1 Tax=Prunus dulcis TaxID=3755 RepID=A0A5E4FXF8_PRUDU|nr:PREDICTED: DOWNY MILDEW RESISTANCE [Prunus dulcis]
MEPSFKVKLLDLDLEDHELLMKFIGGLPMYISKDLRLFKVEDFEEAIVMAIAIESKNKKVDKKEDKDDSRKFEVGSSNSKNREQSSGKKQKNCEHCNKPGHNKETCYILHLELREKEKEKRSNRKDLNRALNANKTGNSRNGATRHEVDSHDPEACSSRRS